MNGVAFILSPDFSWLPHDDFALQLERLIKQSLCHDYHFLFCRKSTELYDAKVVFPTGYTIVNVAIDSPSEGSYRVIMGVNGGVGGYRINDAQDPSNADQVARALVHFGIKITDEAAKNLAAQELV